MLPVLLLPGANLEFTRFKRIDFYPPRPGDSPEEIRTSLARAGSICIATKSRNMGDSLVLTTLPGKLKQLCPGLRISTYPRAFNPAAFYGNPAIDGMEYLPDSVHGDDCNWGEGQLVELKESYFGIPPSSPPRPEIHLTPAERDWIGRFMAERVLPENPGKPLCVLHPWGYTRNNVAQVEFWDALVARWKSKIRFWQVGVLGHGAVQGCEYYFLTPRAFRHARRLFAVLSQAQMFIGVDSGPMHAARAFDIPSLILLNHVQPERVFENRKKGPYLLHENWRHAALYAENSHIDLHGGGARLAVANAQIDAFLEARLGSGDSSSRSPRMDRP